MNVKCLRTKEKILDVHYRAIVEPSESQPGVFNPYGWVDFTTDKGESSHELCLLGVGKLGYSVIEPVKDRATILSLKRIECH